MFAKPKQLYYRLSYRVRSYVHIRHWRGRRIHSPFMYGVVREVFMKRAVTGDDYRLAETLVAYKISGKNAVNLQNLYTHCGMEYFSVIDDNAGVHHAVCEEKYRPNLCILFPSVSPLAALDVAKRMEGGMGILAVMYPHRDTKWRKVSARIWNDFRCVSVDRRLIRLYFFDPKLQAQHYRI